MKAAVLVKKGNAKTAFEWKEWPKPSVGEGQVGVEVEAFGLNFADVMARNGLYREAPPMPSVLGYEVVGRITEIGKGVDHSLVGKRVVAFTRFGGYAEFSVTDHRAIVEIGEEVPTGEACALATQYVTAWFAVDEAANLKNGDIILQHAAAGGVGTAVIQMAKNRGCTIIGLTGSDEKMSFLKESGVDHVINYKTSDYETEVKKILKEKRLSATFNSVAGSTFKKDFRLIGSGGKVILYGAAERSGASWGIFSTLAMLFRMGRIIPVFLMMRSKGVVGINMLKIADNRPEVIQRCLFHVVDLYQKGVLRPHVGGEFTIDLLSEAHELLESGRSKGKLVIRLK